VREVCTGNQSLVLFRYVGTETFNCVIAFDLTHLELFPIVTSPTTEADGATKVALSETWGATPSTATKRVEGTKVSVYFVISILLPIVSIAALHTIGKTIKENKM
jgi:hypothetical protein